MSNKPLNFDDYGNLFPYEPIEVDLETLEAYFVTAFPTSKTRKRLFENYLRYIYRFQDEVFPIFEQYINGSFVTKKENPKDIDLVTFLDFEVYEKREKSNTLDKFWSFSLEDEGIDSYLVRDYPINHPSHQKTGELKRTWDELYTRRNKRQHSKGFLKIIFEK